MSFNLTNVAVTAAFGGGRAEFQGKLSQTMATGNIYVRGKANELIQATQQTLSPIRSGCEQAYQAFPCMVTEKGHQAITTLSTTLGEWQTANAHEIAEKAHEKDKAIVTKISGKFVREKASTLAIASGLAPQCEIPSLPKFASWSGQKSSIRLPQGLVNGAVNVAGYVAESAANVFNAIPDPKPSLSTLADHASSTLGYLAPVASEALEGAVHQASNVLGTLSEVGIQAYKSVPGSETLSKAALQACSSADDAISAAGKMGTQIVNKLPTFVAVGLEEAVQGQTEGAIDGLITAAQERFEAPLAEQYKKTTEALVQMTEVAAQKVLGQDSTEFLEAAGHIAVHETATCIEYAVGSLSTARETAKQAIKNVCLSLTGSYRQMMQDRYIPVPT